MKAPDAANCKQAVVEQGKRVCPFTGWEVPACFEPHGCPLDIRPRAIPFLSPMDRANARTLLHHAVERGQGDDLVEAILPGLAEVRALMADATLAGMAAVGE